jgi:type II secretory pathway pseudopilin PulG
MTTELSMAAADACTNGRSGERGMSLVELMIATVVMVVGLVGIMNSCVKLHALQRLDGEVAFAYRACMQTIEDLRAMPLASLPGMNATGFDVPGPDATTPLLAAQPGDRDGLPGAITVQQLASNGGRLLYRITAAAAWRGASGNSAVQLSTYWGGVP